MLFAVDGWTGLDRTELAERGQMRADGLALCCPRLRCGWGSGVGEGEEIRGDVERPF